jgi:hypothetical protein
VLLVDLIGNRCRNDPRMARIAVLADFSNHLGALKNTDRLRFGL